jgi:hypothetical protein
MLDILLRELENEIGPGILSPGPHAFAKQHPCSSRLNRSLVMPLSTRAHFKCIER